MFKKVRPARPSRFGARSVLSVREHGKRATPVCASRFGKARERRWRLFSPFPLYLSLLQLIPANFSQGFTSFRSLAVG